MKKLLLCSQDPLLVKGLYGPLRDDGYSIDIVEYLADSVRWFLHRPYNTVILDSRNIGLNAFEAASIMRNVFAETPIFVFCNRGVEKESSIQEGIYVLYTPVELDRFMHFFHEIMLKRYPILLERRIA